MRVARRVPGVLRGGNCALSGRREEALWARHPLYCNVCAKACMNVQCCDQIPGRALPFARDRPPPETFLAHFHSSDSAVEHRVERVYRVCCVCGRAVRRGLESARGAPGAGTWCVAEKDQPQVAGEKAVAVHREEGHRPGGDHRGFFAVGYAAGEGPADRSQHRYSAQDRAGRSRTARLMRSAWRLPATPGCRRALTSFPCHRVHLTSRVSARCGALHRSC
jgi:hypothetical protein